MCESWAPGAERGAVFEGWLAEIVHLHEPRQDEHLHSHQWAPDSAHSTCGRCQAKRCPKRASTDVPRKPLNDMMFHIVVVVGKSVDQCWKPRTSPKVSHHHWQSIWGPVWYVVDSETSYQHCLLVLRWTKSRDGYQAFASETYRHDSNRKCFLGTYLPLKQRRLSSWTLGLLDCDSHRATGAGWCNTHSTWNCRMACKSWLRLLNHSGWRLAIFPVVVSVLT